MSVSCTIIRRAQLGCKLKPMNYLPAACNKTAPFKETNLSQEIISLIA